MGVAILVVMAKGMDDLLRTWEMALCAVGSCATIIYAVYSEQSRAV